METKTSSLKRVFINNIDSYSSKYIAKFLSECVAGAHDEDEEEGESVDTNNKEKAFEIVGTVSEESQENRPYVLEQYCQLKREELLPKLMDCHVIVYNITQHQDQVDEAFWAVSTLHKELDNFTGPKMFILVSTVMTWVFRKPIDTQEDDERPFTDEDFRRRKPHANFKAHNDLEKSVVKLRKTNKHMFSTYVVVSGMQYGMGEQIFHYFFKTSWEGVKAEIPVFGDGTNIVPTIHINDLASVIQNVIEHRPIPYYLLAVDYSSNTMEEIVQAISNALGSGSIKKIPLAEAYLIREITVMEIDCMTVNLRMESVHLRELSVSWQCENGLVENIGQVVHEYKENRGLQPLRICVMGPPAVGKSTLSEMICDHYKLHHVKLKPTIAQTFDHLKETVSEDPFVEKQSTADAQELLTRLTESIEHNEGVLDEQLLLKVVRDKLMTKPCQNQGFVLDGFPKTYDQTKELYENEEEEEEDETTSNKILPEFVFVLEASDLFLKERVINLPETEVEKNNYEPEHFLERLSRYRHRNSKDSTVSDFYDEINIATLNLEITSEDEPNCLRLLDKIIETVGPPRNYGPTIEEVEEEERKKMEEKQRWEAQRKEEEETREAEEARERAARWEEWSRSVEQLRREEEDLLEAQTAQMRSYLMEHVMPTLSQGLLACCSAQPQDPVDFLAEYLMNNNPLNWTKL